MSAASVIVFGYGELGITAVRTLAAAGAQIRAIVVPGNRSGEDIERIAAFAAAQHIPLWIQPPRREIEPFVRRLHAAAPDIMVIWSYSMLLPQAVLDVPRLGVVNVHGGLLPAYRGGHVMQWALINGERETGVTLHYVDRGIDTGPVIADARFAIQLGDDAVRVRAGLATAGEGLLRAWWPSIAAGTAPRLPQDDTRARYWPMRTVEEGRIDWTADSEQICRLVRALACNEPGAFVDLDGTRISVRAAQPLASRAATGPGRVVAVESRGVRVSAGAGDVLVTRLMVAGTIIEGASVSEVLRPGLSMESARSHE